MDTLTGYKTKTFSSWHLVNKFQTSISIPEYKFQTTCYFFVYYSSFKTLHNKCRKRSVWDGIYSVCVTVEIEFKNNLRVKNTTIRSNSCRVFIFRSVNNNFVSLIRTSFQLEVISRLCARNRTTIPTSVYHSLGTIIFYEHLWRYIFSILMWTVLKVVHRQQVILIHHFDYVCSTNFPHVVLAGIVMSHFFMKFYSNFVYYRQIVRIIHISFNVIWNYHYRFNSFISKNSTNSASTSLFKSDTFSSHIIKCKIQQSDSSMFCSSTCCDYGH